MSKYLFRSVIILCLVLIILILPVVTIQKKPKIVSAIIENHHSVDLDVKKYVKMEHYTVYQTALFLELYNELKKYTMSTTKH